MNISDLVPWRERRAIQRRNGDDMISSMRQEMDRLFDDFFRSWDPQRLDAEEGSLINPALNLAETDEVIEATMELPGLSQEDIEITLSRDGLTITGEKKEEGEEQGKNYFRRERSYGYFRRIIPLPVDAVEADRVEAAFDKGVLKVTMPKKEAAKGQARRIEVKAS